mmetsp:Transcript_32708/g.36605  ORF Transcript_32708/g.36605 Transcript_32708/m.36605 type:complete len:312 (-) Transcript_32708:175-1110(-)
MKVAILTRRSSSHYFSNWHQKMIRYACAFKKNTRLGNPSACRQQYSTTGLLSLAMSDTEIRSPEELLKSFADLDHDRSRRTSFPEAVFGQGKTPNQIASILDDMARHFNERVLENDGKIESSQRVILATRVSSEMYESVKGIPLSHGHFHYHPVANILSMIPSCLANSKTIICEDSSQLSKRIVVATAGTTDLPVAEEAAVVLEAAQCKVDRIYDVGVAGLHRIIKALPRLQSKEVGCIIVCAGMDGALPSVVGGLVSCPVVAVPTSIGYGASLNGISALLTMLNSCAPGVGVVNIDNGFGAAALAYKCIR